MLLGPSISIELIRFVAREHGRQLAAAFTLLLAITVASLGWLLDSSDFGRQFSLPNLLNVETTSLQLGCLLLIVLLISWSLLRRGARAFVAELLPKIQLFSHRH